MKRVVLSRFFLSALGAVFVCSALAFSPGGVRAAAMSDNDFVALCNNGTAAQVKQALRDGANPNARHSSGEGTGLMEAARLGRVEIIRLLLDAGADVEARNAGGEPVLFYGLEGHGGDTGETLKLLLDAGADPNTKHDDKTALMRAAKKGNVPAARALLAAGADAKLKDDEGHDALWHARHPYEDVTKKEQAAIIRLLQGGGKKKPAAKRR